MPTSTGRWSLILVTILTVTQLAGVPASATPQKPVAYAQTVLAAGEKAEERVMPGGELELIVAKKPATIGSGVPQGRRISSLTPFERLDLRVGVAATIEIDSSLASPVVEMKIDDNLSDAISFRSDGVTLVVEPVRSFRTTARPTLTIVMPRLSSVRIGSTTLVSVRGLDQHSLAVSAAGAAAVRLTGAVRVAELAVADSSSIDATAMRAEAITVSGAGSATCIVGESRRIDGHIAGSAKLLYRSASVLSVARDGAGRVELVP